MKVKNVMHEGVDWVESTATIKEIAKHMRDRDVGAVPVRADGKIIGIVTDRDLACRGLGGSGDIARMTAKDIMTKDVICCSPEDDVQIAVQLMETKKIRRLPVTDSKKAVIGMLSLGDLSHKLGKDMSSELLRAVSAHHA